MKFLFSFRQYYLVAILVISALFWLILGDNITYAADVKLQKIPVLILTGRNNHDWQRTTLLLKNTLEASGRFTVDVSEAPPAYSVKQPARPGDNATQADLDAHAAAIRQWIDADRAFNAAQAGEWEKWRPDFRKYGVIVNNYNGIDWPDEVKQQFTDFVRKGGGLVNIHAANNCFGNWPEYNEMLGIAYRGKNGTRIVIDGVTGEPKELPAGSEDGKIGESSGHGGNHEFTVIHRQPTHPILGNLPASWLHGTDELYHGQRGPAGANVHILASAWSDPKTRGSGQHEPVLWFTDFGKGKVVTTSLGHLWSNQTETDALRCIGFQTILARSAEWAATGKVTIYPPDAFPSAHKSSLAEPENVQWQGAAASINTYDPGKLRFPPKTPEESLASIELPKGYRAELVAADPMIEEPVWAAWDGNGALYVAEMNSYMQDAHGTGTKTERNGRIKRLEDTNGDGHMDKVTIFVNDLLLPRMILPLDERILVQETYDSSIYSYRDTTGDGIADEKILIKKGNTPQSSVEHQDSALTWNIDNWIYTAEGGSRHRFTRGKWETERAHNEFNQWGMGMDDTGIQYYSQNAIPGRSFQQPWYAWNLIGKKTDWKKFERPSLGNDTDGTFQLIHPLFPVGDRSEGMGGSWTSACGISVYRGDALPEEMRGSMILAEPCSHLVRRSRITRNDNGTSVANLDPHTEFFLSRDFYTRPVSTHTGPDGALYIVDMYRGIIQDSPWVGPEFVKRIEDMGFDQVKNRGRIYRIVHDSIKPSKPPRLLDAKPAELVPYLSSTNGWIRDNAQKLLILRADQSVKPALEVLSLNGPEPLGRLHALWTLEGLDALDPDHLVKALKDPDPRVREAAVRLHEPWLAKSDAKDPSYQAALTAVLTLKEDPATLVKRQVILSLGQSSETLALQGIQDIAAKHLANGPIFLAAATALFGQEELPFVKSLKDGSAYRAIPDPLKRAKAQSLWKPGLDTWKGLAAVPRKLSPEAVALMHEGANIYATVCSTCHGENGKGVTPPGLPPLAPDLDGSPFAQGPKAIPTRILLSGLTGPIHGKEYAGGLMAPLGGTMPDEWTAAVLTYIRNEWQNQASPILPAEVAAIRAIIGDRTTPYTQEELAVFSAPELPAQPTWKATANGHNPALALDGIADSWSNTWNGQNKPGNWIAVDLGAPHELTHLVMETFVAERCVESYEISVSQDGKEWSSPIATGHGEGLFTTASFEPVTTRHIRITQTGDIGGRWMISQLHIHGVKK